MGLSSESAPWVALYGFIPALCMFISSVIVSFWVIPPPKVVFGLQHLAGGIILSAVAIEFVPILTHENHPSPWDIPVIIVAFFAGAGLFIGIGKFIERAAKEEEKEKIEGTGSEDLLKSSLLTQSDKLEEGGKFDQVNNSEEDHLFKSIRKTLIDEAYKTIPLTDDQKKSVQPVLRSTLAAQEKAPLSAEKNSRYPVVFALAVAIDAFLDGLFIGITYAASEDTKDPSGVFVLALSLCIEMSCLGSTFSLALPKNCSLKVKFGSFALGPLILFTTAFLGSEVGIWLLNYPIAFQALTSFGASALIFTVGQELLTAGHGDKVNHAWWIDIAAVFGFLLTIVIDKLFRLY
jgi:zinc transporter ZupT